MVNTERDGLELVYEGFGADAGCLKAEEFVRGTDGEDGVGDEPELADGWCVR